MAQLKTSYLITLIVVMITAGAINTIAYKFQNKQMVYEAGYYKFFFHPYMQAVTMFFGEALAFPFFILMRRRDPEGYNIKKLEATSQGKQVKFSPFLIAIPGLSDLVSSTMQYISLNYISGSVWQMVRGGTIVTTFLFSLCYLKRKPQKHQIVGSILAVIGVLLVGVSTLAFASTSSASASPGLQIIGYALLIGSLILNGFQFTFEQNLMEKYHIDPLQMVGFEGIFGFLTYVVILCIITFVPCGFGPSACVLTQAGMPFLQRPDQYLSQAVHNGLLFFFCVLGIFSMVIFNVLGVTVTQKINAVARTICDVSRTVVVWAVSIIMTVTAGVNKPNYEWQLVGVGPILVQLLGFSILLTGNLIYNKILQPGFLKQKRSENPLLGSIEEEQNDGKGQSLLSNN